jgi:hypothetical protein
MIRRAVAAASLSLWASVSAAAQSTGTVDAQVERVRTGTVRMTFAARDGVCGNGMSWYRTRSGSFSGTVINGNWSGARDVEASCERGPVRLVIVRKDGETTELRSYVGGTWKADTGISDLGNVRAGDAAAYLLRLAENAPAKPARSAISAATLADSVDAAPVLLRIAKDESRPNDVRSSALNWLGEVVGDKVASTLDSIAYETGDREVRKQAIFAMSRRPADESIPALLKMAETLPDRELRKTAVFWLAQSRDPRAISWMESRIGR